VGDGDIILTADKKLQTAIGMVEPSGTVQVKTTEEIYHRGFIFVPKTPRNKRFKSLTPKRNMVRCGRVEPDGFQTRGSVSDASSQLSAGAAD